MSLKNSIRALGTISCVLAALLQAACAQTISAPRPAPDWTLKLADVQGIPPPTIGGETRLLFLDDQHLVVTQVDPTEGNHMNISLASVNAESGTPIKTQALNGLEGGRTSVETMLVKGGALIVLAGPTLTEYSSDLRVLAARHLPANKWRIPGPDREIDGSWSIIGSLSSSRAYLSRIGPRGYSEGQWISAATLADDGPKLKRGFRHAVLTKAGFAFNDFSDLIEFQKIGEEYSHPICPECKGSVRVGFGGDLVFVASNPASSFFVVDSNAAILHRVTQGKGPDNITSTSGAASARRVAYTTGVISLRPSPQSIGRVVVFDLDRKGNVLDLDLVSSGKAENTNGVRVIGFSSPQVALSPNGLRLAVLSERAIQFYKLGKP
jgi:hypothetical protein